MSGSHLNGPPLRSSPRVVCSVTRKNVSPLDVYRLLPQTNCTSCGERNCLAFATRVANLEIGVEKCSPLVKEEYANTHDRLKKLLAPCVKEIIIGTGEHAVKIGGKVAMYRHEFGYANPTAVAIDVTDEMPEQQVLNRVRKTELFSFEYIGRKLKLDLIAVRSTSNDPSKFRTAVEKVSENTRLPLILCSPNPKAIEAGLKVIHKSRPLLHAATRDNWEEMANLALTYKCPLAVLAPNDLEQLRSLVRSLVACRVEDLVLDPGTFLDSGLSTTIDNFTVIRKAACRNGDELLGFPIMGAPLVAWTGMEGALEEIAKWREAYLAAMLIVRFADILVVHNVDGWALLPIAVLRENLYNDPRKPVSVPAGLRTYGAPNEWSPVMFTTNFALTFYTVSSDLESAKTSAYLIVVDTGGIAVDSAVAGRKLTALKVAKAIETSGVSDKVCHRKLIIPGKAARLSEEIERLSHWQVLIGPKDSSGIPKFLQENWNQQSAS